MAINKDESWFWDLKTWWNRGWMVQAITTSVFILICFYTLKEGSNCMMMQVVTICILHLYLLLVKAILNTYFWINQVNWREMWREKRDEAEDGWKLKFEGAQISIQCAHHANCSLKFMAFVSLSHSKNFFSLSLSLFLWFHPLVADVICCFFFNFILSTLTDLML